MPMAAPKPCSHPLCAKHATKKGRCDKHQRKAWDHKGKSRHERGYGNDWDKARSQRLALDENLCQECKADGIYTLASEVDHIIPKAHGGTNNITNLRSLCKRHHTIKTKKESREGRRSV